MTIRIMVKNEDSRDTAVVVVKSVNLDGSEIAGMLDNELKGGESCDRYVHSTQQLVVKEIRNG